MKGIYRFLTAMLGIVLVVGIYNGLNDGITAIKRHYAPNKIGEEFHVLVKSNETKSFIFKTNHVILVNFPSTIKIRGTSYCYLRIAKNDKVENINLSSNFDYEIKTDGYCELLIITDHVTTAKIVSAYVPDSTARANLIVHPHEDIQSVITIILIGK